MIRFKILDNLLHSIRHNLAQDHAYSHERVGFLIAGIDIRDKNYTVLAHSYLPVDDSDYHYTPRFGATVNRDGLFKMFNFALKEGVAIFHIHSHGRTGLPRFSAVDIAENNRIIPEFFKYRPDKPHGAIVLSDNRAIGRIWLAPANPPSAIDEFHVVGKHTYKWRT